VYDAIRKEYIRLRFLSENPSYRKCQQDEYYRTIFNAYYEKHKYDQLDIYGRFYCFVLWLLKTDEWTALDNGDLRTFYRTLQNHENDKENFPVAISDGDVGGDVELLA